MSSWTNGRIRSGGVAVLLLLVVVISSCSGGNDRTATPTTTSAPSGDVDADGSFTAITGVVSAPTTIALPDCGGVAVAVPADWPIAVTDVIVATAASRDGDLFLVRGITNQPELALTATMENAFPGFDVGEPTGGDNDISVNFTAINGTGDLRMSDNDTDGCWDVELAGLFEPGAVPPLSEATGNPADDGRSTEETDQPDDGSVAPEAPENSADGSENAGVPAVASTVAPPEVIDPLDEINAVGTGEIVTGRSTYQIQVTRCSVEPLRIEAVAVGGTLSIEGDPGRVTATWTYDDGEVISSNEANVFGLNARGGSIIADGQNAEGPETIFVTFLCNGA